MHLEAYIVTICIVIGPTCCVTRCVHVYVCVCPCVSLLLLATTCKSQFHDSHAHFTDNKTTQKGAGRKEEWEGRGWKKNKFWLLHFAPSNSSNTVCIRFPWKTFGTYTHTTSHTLTHTHARSVHWLQCSKIQTETSFFSFHMRHTINDPPPPLILCSDTLPVPTLAAQFFTISVLFSFMALLFFCFCPPLVVF